MNARPITLILGVGVLFSSAVLISRLSSIHLPGNQQGYAPTQPIAFSHRLHAGELQVDCMYCHSAADKSRHAGIPAASICMNCHKYVTAPLGAVRAEDELARKEGRSPKQVISPELRKLYDALGLDRQIQPEAAGSQAPIEWIKIHNLPDFVYFDHRPHVTAGVACQRCHGPVETMERVYQVEDLSMGWCVNCHRQANTTGVGGKAVHATIDCVACHH